MSIAIYSKPIPSFKLSNDSLSYNPFSVSFNGELGGNIVRKLYVRNDDLSLYYSSIQLVPVDSGSNSIVDGTLEGWTWKLMEKDVEPDENEWDNISAGNTLSLSAGLGSSSLGDTATYLSFWVRVEIPENQLANNIKSVSLRLTAIEGLVS